MAHSKHIDTDTFNYYPLQDGKVPASSVGMKKFSKLPEDKQKRFHIDQWFDDVRQSKMRCRKESISKYYQEIEQVTEGQLGPIYQFWINELLTEYPHFFQLKTEPNCDEVDFCCLLTGDILVFSKDLTRFLRAFQTARLGNGSIKQSYIDYKSGLDALAMQVQEDIVIYTQFSEMENDDGVSRAHLMSAADWNAEWGIGKSFTEIHARVKKADGSPVIKHPAGMIQGIMKMPESIERIGAISFRTALTYNLHPANNPGLSWTWDDKQELYCRFERQTVTIIPGTNSFLFTIRPYFANLLSPTRIESAIMAIENFDENSYSRDVLQEQGKNIVCFLKRKRDEHKEWAFK